MYNKGKQLLIASDHAGYELKEKLKEWLSVKGYSVSDYGTDGTASMDYPDVVHPMCRDLSGGDLLSGILICGSGNGVAITANKYSHIRAALCWNPEIASLARQHNNANVLCLPARFLNFDEATEITTAYLEAEFEGGRHQQRIDKIAPK